MNDTPHHDLYRVNLSETEEIEEVEDEFDTQMTHLLTPDLPPGDEGDTAVDDLLKGFTAAVIAA